MKGKQISVLICSFLQEIVSCKKNIHFFLFSASEVDGVVTVKT